MSSKEFCGNWSDDQLSRSAESKKKRLSYLLNEIEEMNEQFQWISEEQESRKPMVKISPKHVEITELKEGNSVFYLWSVRFGDERWPTMGHEKTFDGAMTSLMNAILKGPAE